MAIEYSNTDTSGCNYIIDQSVFTIINDAVEFDQNVLDDIKSGLAICSNIKSIDSVVLSSLLSNSNKL